MLEVFMEAVHESAEKDTDSEHWIFHACVLLRQLSEMYRLDLIRQGTTVPNLDEHIAEAAREAREFYLHNSGPKKMADA